MEAKRLVSILFENGIRFFAGVPDSYLHGFCSAFKEDLDPARNVIAANEGNAVGVAAGNYLATGDVPLVYMQNSGLGNAVNPLASLACHPMLGIPMILLIGWRGDPRHSDHVQHALQGKATPAMLDSLGIPYMVLGEGFEGELLQLIRIARTEKLPVAVLAPKGVLDGRKSPVLDDSYPLSREQAIEVVISAAPEGSIFSATTGRASRELYHVREKRGEGHSRDYLNVGSMGHASSVALGMALGNPTRRVVCLDGDAAAIMHMGSLAVIPSQTAGNLLHVVLNNGAHESVGGQPSVGWKVDFTAIADACGYETVGHPVSKEDEIASAVVELCSRKAASFLDVRIRSGMREGMPSLEVDPVRMRDELMRELNAR